MCASISEVDDALTWDGALYRTSHIGIRPPSIVVTGSGGSCPSVGVATGTFTPGYEDGGTYTTDGFSLVNTGTCTSFVADYDYTNCSLTGTSAYDCEMVPDPDGDAGTEYGFCKFFMLYEGISSAGGSCSGGAGHRRLFLAHSQQIDQVWHKHPSSPGSSDVRLRSTNTSTEFVSVPELLRDPVAGVHRIWFVNEEASDPSLRYSESNNDGLDWGITSYSHPRDCWTGSAWDTTACTTMDWSTGDEPPDASDDPGPDSSPDIVDIDVLRLQLDGDGPLELGMMFAGSDRTSVDSCSPTTPSWGVFLFQMHQRDGNQALGDVWAWEMSVYADASDGVVMDDDRGACPDADVVMDPTMAAWASGQFIMLYNHDGGIKVAGSGFQCSDFSDNDSDGYTDWAASGGDSNCLSPVDNSE
jgi:hypothetical protein